MYYHFKWLFVVMEMISNIFVSSAFFVLLEVYCKRNPKFASIKFKKLKQISFINDFKNTLCSSNTGFK